MLTLLSAEVESELLRLVDDRIAERLSSLSLITPASPWLTVAEAAEHLRTTTGAIYKRIKRGQLRAYRPEGSQYLLRRDELEGPGPAARGVL